MEKFKEILENKPLLYTIIICAGLVVVMSVVMITAMITINHNAGLSGQSTDGKIKQAEKKFKDQYTLFTTDNAGKALEVQALLAREQITATKVSNGSKIDLVLKDYTVDERDRALLTIVKSGLLDEHTGLEIFDKGDFTSTKDDKKIRLIRAMNGELARLIRKIPPIENAQVFISIPDQTFFSQNQQAKTATVQITMPSGERLDNIKVKAISNLLLGAVDGLESENISITDTNGNVYNSIIGASDDAIAKLEENDKYMQSKVNTQLDKLIGNGKYTATVSTYLTQSPVEKSSILYDPDQKTSVSEQVFNEKLGDNSSGASAGNGNAVSIYVPHGAEGAISSATTNEDRKYSKTARETQYGVSKTQINEYMGAGIIEKITIAVSIEENAIPANMSLYELKTLIANAASPKVEPEDVSIAFVETNSLTQLAPDKENELPKPEESGNPWWVVGAMLLIGLILGLGHIGKKVKNEAKKQEEELEYLRQVTATQQEQLKDVTQQASNLIEQHEKMTQNFIEQKNQYALALEQAKTMANAKPRRNEYADVINELESNINSMDESEAVEKIKNWIDNG